MAADSRITYVHQITKQILHHEDNIKKIYHVSTAKIGISYWGLAEVENKKMLDFLTEFEESQVVKTDTVDTISGKLRKRLQNIRPRVQSRMGFHLAGYVKNENSVYIPRLRHLFHERWHSPGDFANENCHVEYHLKGTRMPITPPILYPVLYNGDNAIANAIFNYIPAITNQRIEPTLLTLDECLELSEFIVGSVIQRINYYINLNQRRIPEPVGGKIHIVKITAEKGFEWASESIFQRIKHLTGSYVHKIKKVPNYLKSA